MIEITNIDVYGFETSIRGMRSPMNSWDKSDSVFTGLPINGFVIGNNDLKLMKTLSKAGPDHGKFLRMINVTCDINAPLYWWKEYDTYKVGTVANSCSTMHKIHVKEFTFDDFSHEHLYTTLGESYEAMDCLTDIIDCLNKYRKLHLETKDKLQRQDLTVDERKHVANQNKFWWWQMIQLLPSSYNQKRTVQLNYQVLKNMYNARKLHKLDEWRAFCAWCETLPYFKEICLGGDGDGE